MTTDERILKALRSFPQARASAREISQVSGVPIATVRRRLKVMADRWEPGKRVSRGSQGGLWYRH